MEAYMYKEGNKWYVVYGDMGSLLGPDEKAFTNKKDAEEFLKKCKEK